ncbi:MAG TPA: IS66 family transposase [Pirellulales bacterium]|jgi:transposase|nr:IS66 family transposase [Pirellulales bacterium]
MIAANLEGVAVWVATTPIDMRKSFDGLAEVVQSFLGRDPLSGSLFVFRNKGGHLLKIMWWDRDGLAIYYKKSYNPNIAAANKPPQPIDKRLPGPSLLAYVITSKLGDHLPLYRLENIFARQGVQVARSTMCAWMLAAGELIKPLVALLAARVKKSRVVHTDDTTVPVLPAAEDRTRRKGNPCKKGRIWTYLGDEANPYTVYDYTSNRKRDGPVIWLAGYRGYLQADAYGGYDGIYSGGSVIEVACWAHARRKFYDAQDSDAKHAAQMLTLIGELYAIEREAKEQSLDEAALFALRHERSVPVLARIKSWLDTEGEIVLPRSPMAAAITYAQNQWAALNVYVTQGFLNIDNNASERAMKRVAIGRKNWLFAGHDTAAANHARLWSLIASAERHGLDPQRYLTSALAKIGQTPTAELYQFLPDVWNREDAASEMVSARECKCTGRLSRNLRHNPSCRCPSFLHGTNCPGTTPSLETREREVVHKPFEGQIPV